MKHYGRVSFLTNPAMRRAPKGQFALVTPLRAQVYGFLREVPAGFVTDGASIPPLCWALVGHPYSPSSLRAAILHDALCRDHAHGLTSARVHRVFYDALRADGVAWLRARAMHAAVAVFGPRWSSVSVSDNPAARAA